MPVGLGPAGRSLGLGGIELLIRHLDWAGYLVAGLGLGIGSALIGSLIHDGLAGAREKL